MSILHQITAMDVHQNNAMIQYQRLRKLIITTVSRQLGIHDESCITSFVHQPKIHQTHSFMNGKLKQLPTRHLDVSNYFIEHSGTID